MVAEGFSTRRGRRAALVHRDEVNHRLHGRRGARMLALTSGGAIPEVADYRVVVEPDDTFVGTLNEDFAIESMAGRCLSTGQRVVARAAGADRRDARRRREGRTAEHSVLARRGAGAERRTVARGQPSARRHRGPVDIGCRSGHGRRAASADAPGLSNGCAPRPGPTPRRRVRPSATSPRLAPRWAPCRPRTRWFSSGSSTSRAACSSCCTRRLAAASTRPGASRSASVSAGSSTSSCRPRRPRTPCCCRSARSIRFRSPTSFAICTRPRRRTSWYRRCSTRLSSRPGGAGTRPFRWRCRASAAAGRCRRSCSGCRPTT